MPRQTWRGHVGVALASGAALAAAALAGGPDVIVGDIPAVKNWGSVHGVSAYSVATTSCNVGDAPVMWDGDTANHPVIGQGLYRLSGGRFRQVGASWVKHGFLALAQNLCDQCQPPGTGSFLGVHCSDPYNADLNGSTGGLGPRGEINAFTGEFPFPPTDIPVPAGEGQIARKIRVPDALLDPTLNPGALYFAEAQYVTRDDAAAGNSLNNVSYRPVIVATGPLGAPVLSLRADLPTQRQKPAMQAWKDADPGVTLQTVDVPGEGRFILGVRATPGPDHQTHYELALYNQNSDRSAAAMAVTLTPDATATGIGFSDVDYHSGEPFKGTDWVGASVPGSVAWKIPDQASAGANANALRWGTMYNFWFDVSGRATKAEITLFKGDPGPVSVTLPEAAPMAMILPAHTGAGASAEKWIAVADSVDEGTIVRGGPRAARPHFRALCAPGSGARPQDAGISRAGLTTRVTAAGDGSPSLWDIEVAAGAEAKPGYFETVLTLKDASNPARTTQVRVFGTVADH